MAKENPAQQGPTGPMVPTEPQQVKQEPQRVKKEPQQVTTKDPKKVEAGKRLAAINRKKREAKKGEEQVQLERTASEVNQYYGFGTILALGVICGLGYYIYQTKKGEQPWGCCATPGPEGPSNPQQNNPKPHPQAISVKPPSGVQPAQTNKFKMD